MRSSMTRYALIESRFNGGGTGRVREGLPSEPRRGGCCGRGRPAGSVAAAVDERTGALLAMGSEYCLGGRATRRCCG